MASKINLFLIAIFTKMTAKNKTPEHQQFLQNNKIGDKNGV